MSRRKRSIEATTEVRAPLEQACSVRNESMGWRPAPYAVALHEHDPRSEHFIG